jgi:hypothetical protein
MTSQFDRIEQAATEPFKPTDGRRVAHVNKVSENGIPLQQLMFEIEREAKELSADIVYHVSTEEPGNADAGKNVEVANAEHHFGLAVDKRRPAMRRLLKRKSQRPARRISRRGRNLFTVGIAHVLRNARYVAALRLHDFDFMRQTLGSQR